MKKLMLLAGLCCLQPVLHAAPVNSNARHAIGPINAKERAMAHFRENYAWVQDAAWASTPDKGIYCVFHQGNIANRIFYDPRGNWQYSLLSYPPSDLAKSVKERVLENFGGYHISYVNEIQSGSHETVYVINIEDERNIKVIRVTGDEIEVRQTLKKSRA